MKPQQALLALILLAGMMPSCKKEPKTTATTTTPAAPNALNNPADYHQMKTGNYWIYQEYVIDSNGKVSIASAKQDSCYVEKDTTINGKVYHKYIQNDSYFNNTYVHCLRDSSDYMVDETGAVMFSANDNRNILSSRYFISQLFGPEDTVALVTFGMNPQKNTVTVPAGTFTVATFDKTYYLTPTYQKNGAVRKYTTNYAYKVGIVSETTGWYIESKDVWERRLVRYHVQ